ncbi:MAG: ATP-grasp domain-containing protein [Arcobacteraceae bacterium]|nr:ATP-grasp domain-containing protein [Arcobacteraceae bacterium]
MKKIVILGGSHRDIPLIKASQELGYYVITLGDRDYYLGHNYSNKACKINFNDLDKVKELIKEEEVDYIIPGSGEESYLNTVLLAHELHIGNFDTLETAQLVHNKWKFKKFCLENGISTPKGFFYNENSNDKINLEFPIVVKPTNLSGGRGVEVVYNENQLHKALQHTSDISNEIFLEEFIDGKLIAYSIFLKEQKIVYGFLGDDATYLNPYLITSAYPTTIEKETLTKLQNDIEKLAQLLKLVDGMFHLQVLIKNNIPYIIDVTRRIPGDLYPYLIEYSDGVEYSKAVVKAYTTGQIDDEFKYKNEKQNFIIRHCVMPTQNGIYESIKIDSSLEEKILLNFSLIEPEYHITNYLNTQLAIIFIKLDKSDEIENIIKNINKLIQVTLKK